MRLLSLLHPMLIMELIWLAYWQLWEDTPLQPNHPVAWECLEDIECLHHPNHVAKNLVSGCITSKPPSSTTLDNSHLWPVHLVYLVLSPQVLWLASIRQTTYLQSVDAVDSTSTKAAQ